MFFELQLSKLLLKYFKFSELSISEMKVIKLPTNIFFLYGKF